LFDAVEHLLKTWLKFLGRGATTSNVWWSPYVTYFI